MLISPAYAQAAGGGEGGFVALLPIVLIFVVFYFLLIRPQQKKMKQHKAMVEALRRGDRVITAGGMIGSITKVINDAEVQVEIAENVRVRVMRHTIQEVMAKTEPAKESGSQGKERKEGEAAAGEPARPEQKGGFNLSRLLGGGPKSK